MSRISSTSWSNRFLSSGRTLRYGLDGGLSVSPLPGLELGLDLTASEGRYLATGADAIAKKTHSPRFWAKEVA